MKHLFFLLLLFSAAGCASSRHTTRTPNTGEKPYVVILSMDAFRWDLASRSHTPTLDSLAQAGTYAEIFPVYPSNTFPSHYSMATGLHPDHHGVVNNNFYDKATATTVSVFNHDQMDNAAMWGGEPIWNTAERQGLKANIFMWVGSEYPANNRYATVWTPYSPKTDYYQRADWVIDAMTRPEAEIPNLVMWYFEEPDASMHAHGAESPEATARAEHIDSVLCYFFREIRRSPVFDKINFIVTADHGMADLSPDRYLNLYDLLDSTQVIRHIGGSPFLLEVEDGYIPEALRILNRTGHLKAYRHGKLPARFHYGAHPTRLTNLILIPETGWTLDYAPQARPSRKKAAHGFDNRDREMHMVFYASGPDFREGFRQPSFRNQNIYLILTHLLDIEPAPNDGKWRDIRKMFRK